MFIKYVYKYNVYIYCICFTFLSFLFGFTFIGRMGLDRINNCISLWNKTAKLKYCCKYCT